MKQLTVLQPGLPGSPVMYQSRNEDIALVPGSSGRILTTQKPPEAPPLNWEREGRF